MKYDISKSCQPPKLQNDAGPHVLVETILGDSRHPGSVGLGLYYSNKLEVIPAVIYVRNF